MRQSPFVRGVSLRFRDAGILVWMAGMALLLCAALWPQAARAQVASPRCPAPFALSVPHSGSGVVNANACHEGFGIGFLQVAPLHGTVTIDTLASTVTYAHNGNSATSDTFRFDDGSGFFVQVNVTIGPASTITIAPASLPTLTAGTPFNQTLVASGGSAPYTYSVDSGTLPTGLSLSAGGVLSGTPTQRGPFAFSVRATDATLAFGTKSYTPTVAGATLGLSPTSPPNAVVSLPYSVTFTPSGGVAPMSLMWEPNPSFPLPPGLSLSGNTLSGTPTAQGTYTFGIRVTDSSTGPGSWFQVINVTMTVAAVPTIVVNPSSLPAGSVGAVYSQALSGSGGTAPYGLAVTAGALPAGLTLASNGTLSGTPTAGGAFNFTATATDANGFTGSRAYALTIAPPTIAVAPATFPSGTVAVPYSQAIAASGGTSPYTYAVTAGALPAGMTLSATGLLIGTPTASGTFNFTVRATDSSTGTGPYSGSRAYSLVINAPVITLTPPLLADGTAGSAYSQAITASGGTAPYSFAVTAGALPPGLTLAIDGTLSGTPGAGGTFNFTITATDNIGATGSVAYGVTINPPTITVAPATLPAGALAVAYSQQLTSSGGTLPHSFSVTAGALPAGMTLSSTGLLSGTPTAGGTFNFTVTATDSSAGTGPFAGSRAYSLTIAAPVIVLSPGTLPGGTAGAPYSETITASGGTAPYGFSVTAGSLPAGLTLAGNGALAGTATASGTFNFTVTATDANLAAGSQPYSLVIAAPTITLTPSALPDAQAGSAYSQSITASGGNAPYSMAVTAGALPAGLTLSSTGTLSGTPTASGTFNFTATATDSTGGSGPHSGSQSYTLTVTAATVIVTTPTLANGTMGTAYSDTLGASGGTAPYTFVVSAGALPPGLSLSSAGTLSGTPTAAGTFNFTITVTDSSTGSGPFSGSRAFSMTIADVLPIANPVSATVAQGSGANPITLNIVGGVPTSVAIASAPANGTAIASGTTITYQPNAGFSGTDNFTYTATNSAGTSTPAAVVITVADPTLSIAPTGPLGAVVGAAFTQVFTFSGGTAPYGGYAVLGLPAGLSVTATGTDSITVSGTPSAAGTFNLNVSGTDSSTGNGPFTASQNVSLTVNAPALVLSPGSGTLNGTNGVAFSQALTMSGGTAPYTFALTAGALPPGITLDAATGLLSGTPTTPGSFPVTITVTDSSTGAGAPFSLSTNYTIQITPSIVLSPSTVPDGMVTVPYSQSLTASGGTAPYAFTVQSGSLPPGLTLSSSGTLAGVPTAEGAYTFTVDAMDFNARIGTQTYTLLIAPLPTIVLSPTTLPDGVASNAYAQTISASGGTAPYGFTLVSGALPAGLTLSSAGDLAGTPTATGTFNFTLRATDANGFSGDLAYALTVIAPTIAIAPATLPDGALGIAYSQTLIASGGAAPYTYSLQTGTLPAGISFSSAGVLSGTPTAGGTFTFSVRATDANGFTADQSYSLLVVIPTIVLAPATLPDGVGGVAYSQALTASGGTAPYAFSLVSGALPPGLALSSTGVVSGTPTAPGSYTFSVRATDANGATGEQSYTVVITAPTISLTPTTVPDANYGVAYTQALAATGGTAPYTFSLLAGTLPPGIALTSAGVLSGTSTTGGTFNFTVQATDANGFTGQQAYSITLIVPGLVITPATLPDATGGSAYSQTLSVTGGTAPYVFSISGGALPTGLTLAGGGTLSGTPTAVGSFSFQVTVTDSLGLTGVHSYVLVVADAAPVAVDDSAATDAGAPVTIAVTANDTGTISSIAVSAPSNGTASVAGLDVTYTPAGSFFGTDSFTYTATGPGGTSNVATVTVEVRALPVPTGVAQTVTTLAGQAVSFDAAAGGTGQPFTGVTLLSTPSQGVVTVSGTTITYTPAATASGTVTLGYTLDNAFGPSLPITSTVNINPLPMAVDHSATTLAGVAVEVTLTDGATGGPFTAADVVSVSPVDAGTTQVTPTGPAEARQFVLRFTPNATFLGTAQVTYTLDNAYATSAPAIVSIDVTARPDPTQDAEVMGLLAAQSEATKRFAHGQIDNFQSRMERLHSAGSGQGFDNGLSVSIARHCLDGSLERPGVPCSGEPLGSAGSNSFAPPGQDMPASESDAPVGIWTAGSMAFGDFDLRGRTDGFEFETSAISAGIDYRLSPGLVLGGGLGYGRDVSDVGENGTRSKATASSVALYGSHQPAQDVFIDLLLGYQNLSFESRRYVAATGGLVTGDRDGDQWFGSVSATYEKREENYTVAPYLRWDVARATLDPFTEQGDAIWALHYGEQDVDTTTGNLGVRMEFHRRVGWGMFSPLLRLEYQHDFDDAAITTLNYADLLGGPFYRARLPEYDASRFLFGLGAILQTERDWLFKAEYRGLFGNDDHDEQSIMLNVEKQF